MNLKPQPGRESTESLRLERHHFDECRSLLVFTTADRRTSGFPLSWLYRFEHRIEEREERFILHLTEHTVTVIGRGLDVLEFQLKQGEGFHVKELAERYTSIQRNEKAHIASITVEPVSKPNHQTN